MRGYLNHQQIEYVLFHLFKHIEIDNQIRKTFVFLKSFDDISKYQNSIIFLLSDKNIDLSGAVEIDGIPVLFPLSDNKNEFIKDNGNIIFQHDLIKSSFYLLSGYQEYNSTHVDKFGRYPYENSVQAKFGFINKPIVNYYFEFIIKGIIEHSKSNSVSFARKKPYNNFAFFLTHDIDRIKYFDINSLIYSAKLVLGLAKSNSKKIEQIREFINIGFNLINIFRKHDPYWNFDFLFSLEEKNNYRSSNYFLPKDKKHVDAYYSLNQKEIVDLFKLIKEKGFEIGLHGTARSSTSYEALQKIHHDFQQTTKLEEFGIRQHRLLWEHPSTAINQNKIGFLYDTTLGFAGHEGFRNSYCFPFKLYDFEQNQMLPNWEIPLNAMDSTFFYYRKLNFEEAKDSINTIIKETAKYNGVFTLLWHNSFFNEKELPGITKFYIELLSQIKSYEPESLLGSEIIKRLKQELREQK